MCLYSASYHIFSWKITLFKNCKRAVWISEFKTQELNHSYNLPVKKNRRYITCIQTWYKKKVINKVNIDNKLNFTSMKVSKKSTHEFSTMISLTINTSFSLVQTYIKWKIGNLHCNGYQLISNEILQELLQKQFLHTRGPSKFSFGMMIKMWLNAKMDDV